MFNLFKKKEVGSRLPAKRKLVLNLSYSSAVHPESYFTMLKEKEVDLGEEYERLLKIYEDELNEGLAKLNAAKDDEFVKILRTVFQKKYFVSFTLSDTVL